MCLRARKPSRSPLRRHCWRSFAPSGCSHAPLRSSIASKSPRSGTVWRSRQFHSRGSHMTPKREPQTRTGAYYSMRSMAHHIDVTRWIRPQEGYPGPRMKRRGVIILLTSSPPWGRSVGLTSLTSSRWTPLRRPRTGALHPPLKTPSRWRTPPRFHRVSPPGCTCVCRAWDASDGGELVWVG